MRFFRKRKDPFHYTHLFKGRKVYGKLTIRLTGNIHSHEDKLRLRIYVLVDGRSILVYDYQMNCCSNVNKWIHEGPWIDDFYDAVKEAKQKRKEYWAEQKCLEILGKQIKQDLLNMEKERLEKY